MAISVDDIVKQIEESELLQIKVEDVKQFAASFGSDEWCLILGKIDNVFRQFSELDTLNNTQTEKLRVLGSFLASVDLAEVNFKDRDHLAESVGRVVNLCNNAKLQKNFVDVILGWLKKECILSGPTLYPLLKFVVAQVLKHKRAVDIKNLTQMANTAAYAVRCSSDVNFVNELCDAATNPAVFQSQEARRFTIKLYEQTPEQLHQHMKNMLSTCDKKLGKALGELYFRCVTTFNGNIKQVFLQSCLQDFANWSLCMTDETLCQTLIEAMVYVNKKLKVTKNGSDDLFEVYSPFLVKMTEVPNSTFRSRAARMLLTAFPLSSSKSSDQENEELFTRQLDAFERLVEDDVPAVRATAIAGLCELSSCIAEALPGGWLQRVFGKVFVRLAFDVSSPDVRLACVKGLGRLVENHVLWPLAERLFAETKYLLHDKSHLVRAAFAHLLDKVAKLHAFKPWKYLSSRTDFLPRLASDDQSICRPLTSLLLEVYIPPEKDSVAHLDTCINLVDANPVGARNFYRYAITQLTFVRASAFVDIILRHLAIKSARLLKKIEGDSNESEALLTGQGAGDVSTLDTTASIATTIDALLSLTDVAAVCWLALLSQLRQPRNAATTRDLERLAATALPRIFKLCEHFHREASTVVLLASCLPWRVVPVIFQKTVGFLRRSSVEDKQEDSDSNDAFRQTASVAIKALTNWAKLGELLDIILESVRDGITALRKKNAGEGADESKRRSTRKRVRFDKKAPKANVERAGGADIETHLALLDMLLHNRSCVRQLRDKSAQVRDIWEELFSALDLIGAAAADGTNAGSGDTLGEYDRKLILCFEFYCRIGLFLHVDTNKSPAIADDSFLKQLANWLRSHTGIFSGGNGRTLSLFQESLCRIFLDQLTTRLMLEAAPVNLADSENSGLGSSDVFEIALDAIAFIPNENRVSLAESVVRLLYACVVKLTTINGKLTQQERGEHLRVLSSYLSALDESNKQATPATLSLAADTLVLITLLWKKDKHSATNEAEEEKVELCFTRLVALALKSVNLEEDENGVTESQVKKRQKNTLDTTNIFITVFTRFYPIAVRGIFHNYFSILDQRLADDTKARCVVSRWLTSIGYKSNDLPPSFSKFTAKETCGDAVRAVGADENSVDN